MASIEFKRYRNSLLRLNFEFPTCRTGASGWGLTAANSRAELGEPTKFDSRPRIMFTRRGARNFDHARTYFRARFVYLGPGAALAGVDSIHVGSPHARTWLHRGNSALPERTRGCYRDRICRSLKRICLNNDGDRIFPHSTAEVL